VTADLDAADRGVAAAGSCRSCRHFVDEPREVESRLPGLSALGSMDGAVRGRDGLCRHHGRYLAASSSCPAHAARTERLRRAGA
jgi:hypothetical protein